MDPLSIGPGWTALAAGSVLGTYAVAFCGVRRLRRVPAPLAAALALALLVCAEAVIVNGLSLAGAVTRGAVLAVHVGVLAAGAALVARTGGGPRARRPLAPRRPRAVAAAALALAAPLAALALTSALRYAPNNGDSMAYHLARVAHWIENGTVAAYPSGSLRQNVMMPGAEYVLLVLQIISGSDRLAALLQAGAYLVLICAAPTLARLAGAPRRVAPWAAPAIAALPIAALEASSTQNDLVAAAMTVAIVGAVAALRGGGRRLGEDVLLVALACAAAVLVKASALVAAAPFLALGVARAVRRWRGEPPSRRPSAAQLAAALAVGAAAALALVWPELARRGAPTHAHLGVTYPLLGDWADRGANVLRGVLHDVPAPRALAALLDVRLPWRAAALVPGWPQTVPHEDFAGNPLQAAAVVIAILAAAARLPRVPRRGRWAMAGAASAWILFHLLLRDNEYVTRLQLPLFALAPVFLAAAPVPRRRPARAAAAAALVAGVVVAVGWAGAVAIANRLRPPLEARSAPPREDYYRNGPLLKEPQLTALDVARATGCRRLGLFMGESGFEYPLAWQAMQQGIEVRHVFGKDGWPCLVYFEPISFAGWRLPREPVTLEREDWRPAAANAAGVYLFQRVTVSEGAPR